MKTRLVDIEYVAIPHFVGVPQVFEDLEPLDGEEHVVAVSDQELPMPVSRGRARARAVDLPYVSIPSVLGVPHEFEDLDPLGLES